MSRAYSLLAASLLLAACQSSLTPHSNQQPLAAAMVADPCGGFTTDAACQAAGAACAWTAVACPAGADCPAAVCATVDPCAARRTPEACADTAASDVRCNWTAIDSSGSMPALCPVGHDCSAGGYCWKQPPSDGCACLQPLACPKDGACPKVACDCPLPPSGTGGSSGGNTCTCGCPACGPGEACPPCACDCVPGTGGSGGSAGTGGTGGTGGSGGTTCGSGTTGTGTCTCACPTCPAGADCPPCSCSCGSGSTSTVTLPATGTSGGTATGGATTGAASSTTLAPVCNCPVCPAGTACAPCDCTEPPDPCSAHTDLQSCNADTADACGWVSLGIACFTTPCPSGSCMRMSQPADGGTSGGGGCACACPACPVGASCPACSCTCCDATATASGSGGTAVGAPAPRPVTARAP